MTRMANRRDRKYTRFAVVAPSTFRIPTSLVRRETESIVKPSSPRLARLIAINENPEESEVLFNQFMKKTLGQTLPETIVSKSLSNLEITSDPINESIAMFAERSDSLGYLGRDGYDLDGIFFDVNLLETEI